MKISLLNLLLLTGLAVARPPQKRNHLCQAHPHHSEQDTYADQDYGYAEPAKQYDDHVSDDDTPYTVTTSDMKDSTTTTTTTTDTPSTTPSDPPTTTSCPGDECLVAITGCPVFPTETLDARLLDCSSFMETTVTPAATTVTITSVVFGPSPDSANVRRQLLDDLVEIPSLLPAYVTDACVDGTAYSTACEAIGVTATTTTAPTPTVTETVTRFGGCDVPNQCTAQELWADGETDIYTCNTGVEAGTSGCILSSVEPVFEDVDCASHQECQDMFGPDFGCLIDTCRGLTGRGCFQVAFDICVGPADGF